MSNYATFILELIATSSIVKFAITSILPICAKLALHLKEDRRLQMRFHRQIEEIHAFPCFWCMAYNSFRFGR